MRSRAEASDWQAVPARVDIDLDGTCDACAEGKHLVASYPEPDNEPWLCVECAGAADYIASWHPAVVLAAADLLDAMAEAHIHVPGSDREKSLYDMPGMDASPQVRFARAYLGTPADPP